mgnify:CR=1 FL=1
MFRHARIRDKYNWFSDLSARRYLLTKLKGIYYFDIDDFLRKWLFKSNLFAHVSDKEIDNSSIIDSGDGDVVFLFSIQVQLYELSNFQTKTFVFFRKFFR